MEITCPSGLKGTVRGMKVRDEQLFSDRKLVKSGRVLSSLLSTCWTTTLDPGPYHLIGDKLDWSAVTSADRTYTLIQLRIASYGPQYDFRAHCANGACKHIFGWGVSLDEFESAPTADAGVLHIKTGEPILLSLPCGQKLKSRLLTGADEEFFAGINMENERKLLTYNLARRIVEINGKTTWKEILAEVEDMEAIAGDQAWDALDDIEGGVETTFNTECPRCGSIQQAVLPFEAGFFSSRKRFAISPTKETG